MKVLAIDVGEKRVGVALGDELGITCRPFDFYDRSNAIEKIKGLIVTESVKGVVVGLPMLSNGELGSQAKDVMGFFDQLQSKIDIPMEYENEYLSSHLAEERLKSQKKQITEKGSIDAMAACIILESYLRGRSS